LSFFAQLGLNEAFAVQALYCIDPSGMKMMDFVLRLNPLLSLSMSLVVLN